MTTEVASLYLLINIFVVSIPLAFSWHSRLRFVDRWADFAIACLLTAAGFIIWDIAFTIEGIWGFNERYLTGIGIAELPIEEWLFFICIPYACVFTYHSLNVSGFGRISETLAVVLSSIFLFGCVVLVMLFSDRYYTAVTSTLLALFLLGLLLRRPTWIGRLFVALAVLVLPFLVTNGILTGIQFWEFPVINFSPGAIQDQVVWYDNTHNMGVRMFSIPLEDFLYAFLLIGLNISIFEYLGGRRRRSELVLTKGIRSEIAE